MTDSEKRPLWFRALDSVLTIAVFGALMFGLGQHMGREAGFKDGAAAMKTAIFGAIERITREHPHD